jgi:hypothetical protein
VVSGARYPVRLLAAGPGWNSRQLAGSTHVTTLREALAALDGGKGAGQP